MSLIPDQYNPYVRTNDFVTGITNTMRTNYGNTNVMPQPLTNIQAARSYIPCTKGGKSNRTKTKKYLHNIYKMKGKGTYIKKSSKNRTRTRTTKTRIKRRRCVCGSKCRCSRCHTYSKKLKGGGHSQYQNNLPMTKTYSVGGIIDSKNSALANPPPVKQLGNCTNCVDNYNHNDHNLSNGGTGFPSAGWW